MNQNSTYQNSINEVTVSTDEAIQILFTSLLLYHTQTIRIPLATNPGANDEEIMRILIWLSHHNWIHKRHSENPFQAHPLPWSMLCHMDR